MMEGASSSVAQLAQQLSEGFAALSGEYQVLLDHQKQLESKLSWAKQQYLELLKRSTPSTLSQDHLTFLQDLDRAGSDHRPQTEWLDQLSQCEDVDRRNSAVLIRRAEMAATRLHHSTEQNGVKIWDGPSADKETLPPRIQTHVDMSHMEKDFTTAGTPSKLGCPFASTGRRQSPLATPRSSISRGSLRGRRSKRPSFTDPIRAEICGNDPVSASASIDGSAAVCPIRFLDQHAPEDVAKYFENHKHQIPRSHEVCIKRFQSNAESIQQLDRKYGDLVSMIQGLGQKHQEYLPPEPEEDDQELGVEGKTDEQVQKWAKAVSSSLQNATPDEADFPESGLDEVRTAHFDRPLKEIRVGESPSRPWGISIPAKYTDAESSSSVGSAPTASPVLPINTTQPVEDTPKKPSKCPFDHRALGKPQEAEPARDHGIPTPMPQKQPRRAPSPEVVPEPNQRRPQSEASPKVIPQMVFNGPVFLGYPPDQLITLLQNSNLGSSMR